ncbi:MAG: SDR family oxidoreductase [Actinomycetota bacterium]|nr:SDR family oxidoreductase [Actinomycetota bacterium]
MVTGGSGDIGRSVATRFARDGYDVVLHTFRGVSRAEVAAAEVRALGREAAVVRAHLGRPSQTEKLVETVLDRTSGIEAFVGTAASAVMRPVADLTPKHLSWSFQVSALPLVTLVASLRPLCAVALTSPGSVSYVPDYAAAGAAKAAMEALARYLAVELAPSTRVNVVSVGLVDTRSSRRLPQWDSLERDIRENTPMRRLVTPDDVAGAVAWLCSADASMVTGATIVLDGGRHLLH